MENMYDTKANSQNDNLERKKEQRYYSFNHFSNSRHFFNTALLRL